MNIPEELKEAYEFASNNQRLNVGIYSDQFVRELIERIARLEESRFKQAVYHAEDLLTIADLKRKLAEAKSGWDSCISDLREAEKICRAAENSLTEARKLAEWTPDKPSTTAKAYGKTRGV
jgi:hypothetical protein